MKMMSQMMMLLSKRKEKLTSKQVKLCVKKNFQNQKL